MFVRGEADPDTLCLKRIRLRNRAVELDGEGFEMTSPSDTGRSHTGFDGTPDDATH
jgi:hypothetical protein